MKETGTVLVTVTQPKDEAHVKKLILTFFSQENSCNPEINSPALVIEKSMLLENLGLEQNIVSLIQFSLYYKVPPPKISIFNTLELFLLNPVPEVHLPSKHS